jgi:hypothetical protein
MLAMLARFKTTPPHQISSYYSTLMKKRISNVFVKGIFGYLLMAPLQVDTYNYVPTSLTGSFSFTDSLVVTSKSSCALTKRQKQKKFFILLNYPKFCTFFGVRPFSHTDIHIIVFFL